MSQPRVPSLTPRPGAQRGEQKPGRCLRADPPRTPVTRGLIAAASCESRHRHTRGSRTREDRGPAAWKRGGRPGGLSPRRPAVGTGGPAAPDLLHIPQRDPLGHLLALSCVSWRPDDERSGMGSSLSQVFNRHPQL